MSPDPYAVLGVAPSATEAEIRTAYRQLVKLHHPDHNPGDPEAARRFEDVQEAYAAIARGAAPRGTGTGSAAGRTPSTPPPRDPPPDPAIDARLADLERQVREARSARERAERAAREAAAALRREAAAAHSDRPRPTDEELGYVHTDDTLGQILSDARAELSERLARNRENPVARRVSDLIAGLEDLAEGLDPRDGRRKGKR